MRFRRKKANAAVPGALGGLLRLSRNLDGEKFPLWASESDRERVKEKILQAALDVDPTASFVTFNGIEQSGHSIFAEGHAGDPYTSGYILFASNPDKRIAVNNENHLAIEYACNGIDLAEIWPKLDELDNRLAERLDYAWSPRLGYLTATSENTGTALRAEALVQLPGFHLLQEMNAVTNALERMDCRVHNIDSPECPFQAAIYRISNRITIGKDEATLIEDVMRVTKKLLKREQQARQRVIFNHSALLVADYVSRALSSARSAFLVSPQEAMQLLFILRFGVEMNFVKGITMQELDKLLGLAQKEEIVLERFGREYDDPEIDIEQAYADFLNLSVQDLYIEPDGV
ncbi:MAG: hypothetical protein J6Z49_02100 [Kiritimatiellae bacterium]|nr:hypothetical protein [Kiritimatiellia bacterium]